MATNKDLKKTEMRIVLVGKTGAGKSSLGNNLLGDDDVFDSFPGGQSVTFKSAQGKHQLEDGREMIVVDTPGLFDTRGYNEQISKEILRCITLCYPGPHIFILVLRIGRFTQEDIDTVKNVQSIFEKRIWKHMVVVFTYKESLKHKKEKKSLTLEAFVKQSPKSLQQILRLCGNRYVGVNNNAEGTDLEADMEGVMKLLNQTIEDNKGTYYTEEMCKTILKKIEKKKLEGEEEIRKRTEDYILRKTEMKTEMDKRVAALNEAKLMRENGANDSENKIKRLEKLIKDTRLKDEKEKKEMKRNIRQLQKQLEENQKKCCRLS